MGIFDKFFGTQKKYSPLEQTNPLAKYLDNIRAPLEDLANQAKDSLEVVPAGDATYVFIGKPPNQFGIAWVLGGEIFNLKKLADQKNLSASKIAKTSNELSKAYKKSKEAIRYSTKVGPCSCIVTSSETLGEDVDNIIRSVST